MSRVTRRLATTGALVAGGIMLASAIVSNLACLSAFRMLVNPPADLYKPLMAQPLVRDATGAAMVKASFTHRYAGYHNVFLVLPGLGWMDNLNSEACDLTLWISLGDDLRHQEFEVPVSGRFHYVFWGRERNGVIMAQYEVPADFPLSATVTCDVRLVAPAPKFYEKYGTPVVEVAHGSIE